MRALRRLARACAALAARAEAHPYLTAGLVLAAALGLMPFLDNYERFVLSLVAVYALFATGYNLLMGYAGQFDVGQAAFLAIGAYGTALLQSRAGLPFALALPGGGLLAVVLGLVIGTVVLRLRHFYLALVTLAFSQTVVLVLVLWEDLTHGFQGLPVPQPQLPGLERNPSLYVVTVTVAVLMVLVARNIVGSRLGRAFVAIRESEVAAQAMGVDLTRHRITAYAISAFYGGVAGGLLATLLSYITPEGFGIFETIKVLAMIVVGGLGSLLGSILGAAVLTLGAELLRASQLFQEIGFGLLLLLSVILMPRGIAGLVRDALDRTRRRETPPPADPVVDVGR